MEDTRATSRTLACALTLALAGGVIGCDSNLAAEEAEAGAQADVSVMATVGTATISRAEVEDLVASQLRDLDRQRQQVLEQGLEQMVEKKLVELEAAKRGVTVDELMEAEVGSKIGEVTDADVDAFYEENKARIPQPKEQVAGQIRDYLSQQRGAEVRKTLMDGLRASYAVASYLEPLRIEVDTDGFPGKGSEDAPVTIVEFSDFECPFCSRVVPTLERVSERYGDRVRIVFRQFPLDNLHPNARKAAEASLCAEEQGKFWEMHDAMFANQRQLQVAQLKRHAGELGLDTGAFDECLDSGRHAAQVQADVDAGAEAGVTGTPAFLINGRFLSGAQPFEAFEKVIEDELRRAGS